MLPCARSCVGKKIKTLPAACVEPLANRPLLFLYPKWFQDATLQSLRATPGSKRGMSWSAFDNKRSASISIDEPTKYSSPTISSGKPTSNKTTSPPTVAEQNSPSHDVSTPKLPFPPSWMSKHWKSFDQNVKPRIRTKRLKTRSTREKLEILDSERKPYRSYSPHKIDSMRLAKKLAHLLPPVLENSSKIIMKASFLKWHTGTSGENIWKHHDGSGCIVHVVASSTPSDEERLVLFIGTERAREIAIRYLKNLEMDYLDSNLGQLPDGKVEEDTLLLEQRKRIDQTNEVTIRNLKTFSDRITRIVNGRELQGVERVFYPRDASYNKTVATLLMDLFADPKLFSFQTSFALRTALEFCSTNTDIAFTARSIWTSSKEAGIIPDIECFNCEINRCYKVGNPVGISRLIDEMGEHHVRPNISTWAIFFRSLRLASERSQFLQLPRVPKAAHDQFWRELVVQTLVDNTFKPSDDRPNRVAHFSSSMCKTFGDNWLTSPMLQNMIVACTKARAFNTMSDVLQLAAQYSVELDFGSSNALFEAVVRTQWFDDVLILLRLQSLPINPFLHQQQIELAFVEAWKQRLVNTARVLWHYAASHGSIRNSMVRRIAKELAQNKHPSLARDTPPSATIAALIIGVGIPDTRDRILSQLDVDAEHLSQTLGSLSKWTTKGEARHNQLQLAHLLLEWDLTAWQRVKPLEYSVLLNLLDLAYQTDIAWQDQDLLSQQALPDLLQQAVKINLEPIGGVGDLLESAMPMAEPVVGPELATSTSKESTEFIDRTRSLPAFSPTIQRNEADVQQEGRQSLGFNSPHIMCFSSAPLTMTTGIMTMPDWSLLNLLLYNLGLPWRA